jgi:putative SOS response-associated peptidase YedK
MCGRYTLHAEAEELMRRFGVLQLKVPVGPRYNIAPSQIVPGLSCEKVEDRPSYVLDAYKWGFDAAPKPSAQGPGLVINARMETLLERPMFKNLFVRNRCLIPANAFYEWDKKNQTKGRRSQPYAINVSGGELVGFAGLWRPIAGGKDGVEKCFVIITVPSNDKMSALHDRMPAILSEEAEKIWLDPNCDDKALLLSLLRPYPDPFVNIYPVSTMVNSTKIDSKECIAPAAPVSDVLVEKEKPSKPTQLSLFDISAG